MKNNSTKEENIHAYGLWALRIALLIGAIVLAICDKDDASFVCGIVLFCSFFIL